MMISRANHNNRILKRTSTNWRKASAIARANHPYCTRCGTTHDLTGDYEGDHSKARWQDITVLCRTCHSKKDGGRPPRTKPRFFLDATTHYTASRDFSPHRIRSRVW